MKTHVSGNAKQAMLQARNQGRNARGRFWLYGIALLIFSGCEASRSDDHWLGGSESARWKRTAEQFRGFDVAMVELSYRNRELKKAVDSNNREYALYQIGKIKYSMELALERRPKRSKSVNEFLQTSVSTMTNVLKEGSEREVTAEYARFQSQCTACHAKEGVGFVMVDPP